VVDNQGCHRNQLGDELYSGVRRIRGEMNIAPGKPLPVLLQNGSAGWTKII